jgi:hypothetical protein
MKNVFRFAWLASTLILSGCEFDLPFLNKPYASAGLQSYFAEHPFEQKTGQVRFLLDDFGSLNPKSLTAGNIIPIKIYFTALLLANPERAKWSLNGARDVPKEMERYGFIRPESLANWRSDLAPAPRLPEISGFIKSTLDFDVPLIAQRSVGVKHFRLEVGNITCAACHSGVTYDASGTARRAVWLGAPNTSLNIDGFFDQVYRGLKIGMADRKAFLRRIKQAYPAIDPVEEKTITSLFETIGDELVKYEPMNRVFSFPNGGPGLTNGVGAFKRDAKLVDVYKFNPHEAGIVSIPDISYRGFRTSLTYDGAYGVRGKRRFAPVDAANAQKASHLDDLANLAGFFTYSAMGNNIKNIEPHLPRVRQVFQDFLKNLQPPRFPGVLNSALAARGQKLFAQGCAGCHGQYDRDLTHPKLLSFPNKFIAGEKIGTDPQRWQNVDVKIRDFTEKTVFAKYIDAGYEMGGYVAPILAGVWYTAPYLHNGSVPTLWQLMNPSERAVKFQLGGHALDYGQVGIAGVRNAAGEWMYPAGFTPWMQPGLYDTTQPGQGNRGHEGPFAKLSADDKWALIEYLKLL